MNTLSSFKFLESYKKETIAAAAILIFWKTAATVSLFFLPSSSLEYAAEESRSNYYTFDFPKAVSISKVPTVAKKTPKKKAGSALSISSLTLKAIYAQEDGGGFIMVVNKSGKDALISRGETYEGYLLKKIFPKKALFEKNGKDYELHLKEAKIRGVTTVRETKKEVAGDTPQKQDRVAKSEIKRYRNNINLIQKEIRLAPVKEGNKIKGFKITYVKKGSVFEKLGVQKGDRLIKANGIELTSAKDALKLYKQIDKIKVFKMVLLRNGKERELEYEIY